MIDIFIAYSSRDRLRVRPLAEALKGCGWKVWWDEETPTGARIDEAVRQRLESARAVVAVFSLNTHYSDWFYGETETARERNVLFPVLLDEMELPTQIRRYKAARFADWSERPASPEFQTLAYHIARVLGSPFGGSAKTDSFKVDGFASEFEGFHPSETGDVDGETSWVPEKGEGFVDPTVVFPVTSAPSSYRFDEAETKTWAKEILSRRVIAFRSPNDEITAAAVDSLLAAEELGGYDPRLLAFGVANQQRKDLFLENVIRHDLGKPNRATIVVVDSHGALPFIESTLLGPHQAKAIEMEMKWRDLLMVIQVPSRYLRDLQRRFRNFRFPCVEVDFLGAMLKQHFPEAEARVLLERLAALRQKGSWGPPDDDLAFYEVVQSVLSGERESLRENLDRLELERVEGNQERPAISVFQSGPSYYRGILFSGAFFPSLDVNEFKKLCLAMVGETKIFVADSTRDAAGSVRTTNRESTLEKEWPRVADDIFEECGLVVRASAGIRAVAFERPEVRAALAAHIEARANYFTDAASKLWATGLLFEPEASPELVDGITDLFVAALRHDKILTRPGWLSEMLIGQLSDESSRGLLDFAADRLVLSRTSRLLRALLADSEHSRVVESWLAEMLHRGRHLQALELAMHLRYTEGFDYLFWLRRFSDESSGEIRLAGYSALYQYARQSGAQIWDFFSRLEAWLPDPARSASGRLSPSSHFALRLVVEYSFDTAAALTLQDIGGWPPRYPLFRDLALDSDSAERRLSSLISWLFHPAVASLFSGDGIAAAWAARAQLISLWSFILLGLDPKFEHADARDVYRRILRLCRDQTTPVERNLLLEAWLAEADRYRSESERVEGEGYRYFSKRIHLVENIAKDLRMLATDADATKLSGTEQKKWNTAQ